MADAATPPESSALQSVYTSNLAGIFAQLKLSLVVSTYQAGKVILVRHDSGLAANGQPIGSNTHFRTFQKPMGIAVQAGGARQEQFALLFCGPAATPFGQGMWPIQHASLGQFDLFLVPSGRDQEGLYYEAVFNRLLPFHPQYSARLHYLTVYEVSTLVKRHYEQT